MLMKTANIVADPAQADSQAAFLAGVIAATPECIKIVAPDGTLLQMNEAGIRMIEASGAEEAIGGCVFDLIVPEHRAAWRGYHDRVCNGESLSWEFDIISLCGTRRHMETHAVPLAQPDGTTAQLAVTRDITQRKRDERALKANERHLRQLLDSLPIAVYTTDAAGKISFFNNAAVDLWGAVPEIGITSWCGSQRLYDPEGAPIPHNVCPMAQALTEDRSIHGARALLERPDGTLIPFEAYPSPFHDEDGNVVGAVNMMMDISAHQRSAAAQQLLINELNHRVKNSLATVQSIVAQTLRRAPDLTSGLEAVESRIMALARMHDVLTQEQWESAGLEDIIVSTLSTHSPRSGQFAVGGPVTRLAPKSSLAVAMVLHELCTNAVKFGALSCDAGRVSVSWSVEQLGERRRLQMVWTESGGPTVTPPVRRGFGSRLIERGIANELGGKAQLAFAPNGVTCIMEFELDR